MRRSKAARLVLLSRRLQSHCRTPVALKKKMGMASILAISAGGNRAFADRARCQCTSVAPTEFTCRKWVQIEWMDASVWISRFKRID
jgi:hypothetical protein